MPSFSNRPSPARIAAMLKRKPCQPMPASFSMIASFAAPYSNQKKEIAACFALTAQLNAHRSNNINLVAPDNIRSINRFH